MEPEIPMEVTDSEWVYHDVIRDDVPKLKKVNVGKWMLHYPKRMLNSKWSSLCKIFDAGKLSGVIEMKCTTAMPSPRSSNPYNGCIILYCINSEDRDSIMEIGRRISVQLYDYPEPYIYYKTNEQTRVGTIATGATNNSTYRLELEKPNVPLFRT